MNRTVRLDAIEAHAAGEASRVVLAAEEFVRGDTMAQRLDHCRENLHWLRHLLLHEPRGYPGLCGVFVLPPVNPGSHFGIVVLEQGGFTPMSGSNTIATVTAVIEAGVVPAPAEGEEVVIDTAVGTVRVRVDLDGAKVRSVTFANVPTFVVALDHPLELPEFGTIPVDIVFGGQFFAQTDVANLGLELDPANGRALARAGAMIKLACEEQVTVCHPENPGIDDVNLVMLHSGPPVPGRVSRNTVVLNNAPVLRDKPETWTGALDRSPCGTGTSARMTALHARGLLAIGEEFRHHSVIGSEFVGRLVGETEVGGRPAVLPTITGQGWVTGRAEWVLDATDPFPTGYTVGDIWAPRP
ncbi:MAG: proline racemase family protein [Micropruina sp.]|nr:proline racemase family protein [Micropruina sp.]